MVTRHRTTIVCAVAGAVVVVAAALGGVARYTGIRWIPRFEFPQAPLPTSLTNRGAQTPAATPAPAPSGSIDLRWVLVVLAVAAAVALAFLAYRIWRRLRARPPRTVETIGGALAGEPAEVVAEAEEPDAPVVQRGLERALALLDAEREPGDAIVRAWLGLQETAEESGITRRRSETPAEFTARILRRVGADGTAATTLLRLYERVRFGDHTPSDADVRTAREALTELAASWDPATPAASPR